MRNVLWVIVVILAGAAALGWVKASSAGKAVAAFETDRTSLSNQLAKATVSLAERDAAIETVKVSARLCAEDLQTVSNLIAVLKTEVMAAQNETKARNQVIRQREEAMAAARKEGEGLRKEIARLEHELADASARVAQAEERLRVARDEVVAIAADRNLSETSRSELLQKWSDLSAVRAQYDTLRRSPSGHQSTSGSSKRPWLLVIQADGTVRAESVGQD